MSHQMEKQIWLRFPCVPNRNRRDGWKTISGYMWIWACHFARYSYTEVMADLSPVSDRRRRERWVDCGVWETGTEWQMEQTAWKTFCSRVLPTIEKITGEKCVRSGPVSPTQSSVFSQHSVMAQSNPFTASPRDKITDFTDHCQGPFLQKRGRQIAFNDLIITQEICLFLYLVAVFFGTHLSVCFPSLKKSSIPRTAINRFSGCCGSELKIVPSKYVH